MNDRSGRIPAIAEWGGRPESALELAVRLGQLLRALEGPGVWSDLSTGRPLPTDLDGLTQWVAQHVSRDRDHVFESDGYALSVGRSGSVDGADEDIDIQFAVGRATGGVIIPANQITVETSSAAIMGAPELRHITLVDAVVSAWQPDYMTVTDDEIFDRAERPDRLKPELGYLTWISERLVAGPIGLSGFGVSPHLAGTLIKVDPDGDADRVIQASGYFAALEAIRPIQPTSPV